MDATTDPSETHDDATAAAVRAHAEVQRLTKELQDATAARRAAVQHARATGVSAIDLSKALGVPRVRIYKIADADYQ
ncbi:MAG: hypothetical protein Q4G40_12045 [Brachybacterium sp.]|nr:hypothetical protein [Brachybacterium sp.]